MVGTKLLKILFKFVPSLSYFDSFYDVSLFLDRYRKWQVEAYILCCHCHFIPVLTTNYHLVWWITSLVSFNQSFNSELANLLRKFWGKIFVSLTHFWFYLVHMATQMFTCQSGSEMINTTKPVKPEKTTYRSQQNLKYHCVDCFWENVSHYFE